MGKGPSALRFGPSVASNRGRRNLLPERETMMRHQATKQMQKSRTSRSSNPALSPYVIDEFAMTMSDVIRARSTDRSSALAEMGGERR